MSAPAEGSCWAGAVAGGSIGVRRTACVVSHGLQCPPGDVGAARLRTVTLPAPARTVTLKLTWTVPPTGIGGIAQVIVFPTRVRPAGNGVSTVANGSTSVR